MRGACRGDRDTARQLEGNKDSVLVLNLERDDSAVPERSNETEPEKSQLGL